MDKLTEGKDEEEIADLVDRLADKVWAQAEKEADDPELDREIE